MSKKRKKESKVWIIVIAILFWPFTLLYYLIKFLHGSSQKKRNSSKQAQKPKALSFDAVGMFAYESSFASIGSKRKDFDLSDSDFIAKHGDGRRVYQYSFRNLTCTLVPEPDNPYDSDAVAVYVNDKKVGHVPADMCTTVKNIIQSPCDIHAKVGGGATKKVVDECVIIDKFEYNVTVSITPTESI